MTEKEIIQLLTILKSENCIELKESISFIIETVIPRFFDLEK
jgi:hypothetical protein